MRRILTLSVLLPMLAAGLLVAGAEGRLKGVITDGEGQPVLDAEVSLIPQEVSAVYQAKTKKGGKFVMMVPDATRTYVIRIEKEGYQTIQEPIKLQIGGQTVREWILRKGENVAGASIVEVQAPGAKTYNAGAKLFNEGDVDGALAKFQEAAVENPDLAEAWQGQAMIHWSRDNAAEALAAADKAVAADPSNVIALRIRYDALLEMGDERVQLAFDELVAADASPGTARRVFNLGVAAVRANDIDEAIRRFEQAVELNPELPQGWQVLGQLYNDKKQYEQAIAAGQKLLALVPDSPDAHGILYEAYQATGDAERAQVSLAVLKSANPEDLARAFYEQGKALFDAGQPKAAQTKLVQALEVWPDHAGANYTLGLCYVNTGEPALAKKHLQRFVELDPEHPEAASAREMLDFLE